LPYAKHVGHLPIDADFVVAGRHPAAETVVLDGVCPDPCLFEEGLYERDVSFIALIAQLDVIAEVFVRPEQVLAEC
jgi:hypothetical protein